MNEQRTPTDADITDAAKALRAATAEYADLLYRFNRERRRIDPLGAYYDAWRTLDADVNAFAADAQQTIQFRAANRE